jgi:hypothetical protein
VANLQGVERLKEDLFPASAGVAEGMEEGNDPAGSSLLFNFLEGSPV